MLAGSEEKLILVTGATGYVGGHLVRTLKSSSYRIRCLVRRPETYPLKDHDILDVVQGDVLNQNSLSLALMGVHTAFYLVHSMAGEGDFIELDRTAAQNFAAAAKEAEITRIIYLGGLGKGVLSPHLASRQEVGRILRDSGIPTIEFRASIIVGSGSISFEMIRALVEKLPIMVTPRWVRTLAQPISIKDIIQYLVEAIEIPLKKSSILEIGGPNKISYQNIMKEYARQRGLHRLMIPVPLLTPYLSSLWLKFVTPLYVRIGRKLIEGVRNPTVVNDDKALHLFSVKPRKISDAIKEAIELEDKEFVTFRARVECFEAKESVKHRVFHRGSRIFDIYSINTNYSCEKAFEPIGRIGGKVGWYYGNWMWQLRGLVDKVLGGVGMRLRRRDTEKLKPGDIIDFWRVETYEPNRSLRLRAEMKLPGKAWLQFEVYPDNKGAIVYQTAIFKPLGLAGLVYWYGLYPLHRFIFARMLKNIKENM